MHLQWQERSGAALPAFVAGVIKRALACAESRIAEAPPPTRAVGEALLRDAISIAQTQSDVNLASIGVQVRVLSWPLAARAPTALARRVTAMRGADACGVLAPIEAGVQCSHALCNFAWRNSDRQRADVAHEQQQLELVGRRGGGALLHDLVRLDCRVQHVPLHPASVVQAITEDGNFNFVFVIFFLVCFLLLVFVGDRLVFVYFSFFVLIIIFIYLFIFIYYYF